MRKGSARRFRPDPDARPPRWRRKAQVLWCRYEKVRVRDRGRRHSLKLGPSCVGDPGGGHACYGSLVTRRLSAEATYLLLVDEDALGSARVQVTHAFLADQPAPFLGEGRAMLEEPQPQ